MKVIGKDLIITDPCYIAKDADWGESFNWEDYCIEPFSEYEWEDTGYGDGSPKVFSIPHFYNPDDYIDEIGEAYEDEAQMDDLLSVRINIGECGVDSGSFGVFLLDEVKKYNPDFPGDIPKSCYCIIPNFTGIIYSTRDSEGYTHFIMKPEDKTKPFILTD